MSLSRGSVVLVELDPTIGHEQRGMRPCAVVSDSRIVSDQRYPLVCVVPITGTSGAGLLYPALDSGSSGLAKRSYALVDHLRSVDKRRIRRLYGELAPPRAQVDRRGFDRVPRFGLKGAPLRLIL